MPHPRRSAFALRGFIAGALGGVLAASCDYAWSHAQAARFLPHGSLRLLAFLVALYAAVGALGGLAVGALARGLGWATDLGPLARRVLDGEQAPGGEGRRWIAYLVAVPVAAALHGAAVYGVASTVLYR